jgi:hypothetical protein
MDGKAISQAESARSAIDHNPVSRWGGRGRINTLLLQDFGQLQAMGDPREEDPCPLFNVCSTSEKGIYGAERIPSSPFPNLQYHQSRHALLPFHEATP